ncbi:hypothetical protein FRC09_012871 [Ceratobasidium sp. 395]|nr:hypothetical protein FRC09_012871 [Ceratobasidium sp. 395]
MAIIVSKTKERLLRLQKPHAPARKRTSKAGRLNLSVAAQAARDRRKKIVDKGIGISTLMNGLIVRQAEDLGVKDSALRQQVFRSANRIEQRRAPSVWNGFLRQVADEANQGRAVGDKVKVHQLVTDDVCDRYRKLTNAQREEILADQKKYQQSNTTGAYITEKSDLHAAAAKLTTIKQVLESLTQQHNIDFLFVAVRSTPNSHVQPTVMSTPAVDKFIDLAGAEPLATFSKRLEGFCVGGVHELLAKDQKASLDIRTEVRALLNKKLVTVTGDEKATMSYQKYEDCIVGKYGVVLENWPFPKLRNLSEERASNSQLEKLHQDLQNDKIYFRKLTSDEIEARSGQHNESGTALAAKTRATRSDRGKKRGPQKGTLARRAALDNTAT